jgi:hypothetical protein
MCKRIVARQWIFDSVALKAVVCLRITIKCRVMVIGE